ncbi:MAG: 3-carboxy-cis,cis-muconate cycloisomerase [Ideonella sp. MAG2]|nr:MAG: 3-carboxy-cis,cis-muconate cycloisomerase [Ideonella sp. MAG2]
MAASIIDSRIFQGIFTTDAMRQVWSDENRTQKYLDIECALAKVQGRLGLIPQEAADEIVSHCHLDQIDLDLLRQQTERIGYPILGVVSQLNKLCRDKLGEYCHWGATTQDITDTATVLQVREALVLVDDELAAIAQALAKLAREHRLTPIIGRSNLQQAIPVTFGYKMAGLLSAVLRHRERIAQLAALMDAMVADHERSTGPWQIEWIVLPEAFCLLAGALKQMRTVVEGLQVDPVAMRRNIDMTGGLVMSEAVMMGLGPYIGREYAHDLVYDLCRQSLAENKPLLDLLEAHPEIKAHVDRAALARMLDPANYLGQSGVMVDRVLACMPAN